MSIQVRLLPVIEVERDQSFLKCWAELECEAIEPNPFFASEMMLPAVHHLGNGASTQLLIAENGDRIVFLLPVAGLAGGFASRWPVVRPWLHDYCFLGTPLIHRQEDPGEVWTSVISGLRAMTGTSLLMLGRMARDGAVSRALQTAVQSPIGAVPCSARYRPFVRRRPEPTYLDDWLSSKSLGNLRRKRRELSRRLRVELHVTNRAVLDLDAAVEEFLRLEADGWKGRTGTAMTCRPGHARFFREMTSGFAGARRLVLLNLQAGPRILAQSMALLAGCGLFSFKKCYDEAYAKSSPGVQLDLEMLDWFHRTPALEWIDSCSMTSPIRHNSIFRDRRAIATYAVPTTRPGHGFAAAMLMATRGRQQIHDLARRVARARG